MKVIRSLILSVLFFQYNKHFLSGLATITLPRSLAQCQGNAIVVILDENEL